MARARNIKPSIMDNDLLAELEPLTRLLFIYLWMLADREGRIEDRPNRIAAKALPYDRAADVNAMLDDLHKAGFLSRYVANGQACIQILAFTKHQTPHVREAASELPSPEQATTEVVTKHNLGSAQASPGSPDTGYLIADTGSLNPEPVSSEAKASDAAAASAPKGKEKPKSPEDTAKAELWRAAVAVLAEGGCKSEDMARSFMGKLVKDYTLPIVTDAIASAVSAQPADAREYLKATCQRLKGERKDAPQAVTVPSAGAEKTAAYLAEQARLAAEKSPDGAARAQAAKARVLAAKNATESA